MNARDICLLGQHLADVLPLAAKAAERPHEWLALNQAAVRTMRLLSGVREDASLLPLYRTDAEQSRSLLFPLLEQSDAELRLLDPGHDTTRRRLAEQDAKFQATPAWALAPAANSHLPSPIS